MSRTTMRHSGAVIIAIIVAIISLIAVSLTIPRTAQAVQTSGFTVSNILVHGQTRNANSKMTFDWSAEALGRAPMAGEGFELQLPKRLEIASNSRTTKPITYAGKDVGSCVFGADKISCTFDDGITEFADKVDVKGAAELDVVATNAFTDAYTDTTIDFTLNGETVAGQIPMGIAAAGQRVYAPAKFSKYSTPIAEGQKFISWLIDFNPTVLNTNFPDQFAAPDGTTNITIQIKDTVGAGYNLDKLETSPWSLIESNSAENPGANAVKIADSTASTDPRFSMTITGSGNERMITVTGPFKADTNYRIGVPSNLASGAVSGLDYTNEAELVGTQEKVTASRNFINGAKVTIQMKDGYGGIRLVKSVKGPAAAQVPTNSQFTIKLNYTLPGGKTPADYPDWSNGKDPAVADGQNTGTVTAQIPVGSWTNYNYLFPVGTTFTFGEEVPTIPGVTFDQEKIAFTPATATIGNQQISEIQVANYALVGAGTFKVKKVVQKPAGDATFTAPDKVTLSYQCGTEEGTKEVPTDGTAVEVGQFPIGTDCKVVSETGEAVAGYSATATGLNEAVTIAQGDNNIATVTNTYSRDVGGFTITKTVDARDGVVVDPAKEYEFTFTCTKAGSPDITDTVIATAGANGATEINNIPVGYSCAVVENEAKAKEGVDNATLVVAHGDPVTITKGAVANIAVTNTYSKANSQFKIVKHLNAEAPAAATNQVFTFHVVCTKENREVVDKNVTVTGAGEVVVSDIPIGAECVVTEDVDAAKITGYNLVAAVNGGEFTQAVAENVVDVSNVYTKQVGAFTVVKKLVDNDGVAVGKTFEFEYTCTNDQVALSGAEAAGTFTLGAGEQKRITDIPAGSICKVAEKNADVAGADLTTSGITDITVVENADEQVTVTNDYAAWRGNVDLTKELTGSAKDVAAVKALEFDVDYTCTLGTDVKNGTVKVTAGKPTEITGLRSGAKCEFTEKKDAVVAPEGTKFNANKSEVSTTVTVGAKDSRVPATLRNDFTELGTVVVTKEVTGSAAGSSDNETRDYDVEASWVTEAGETKTEKLKVSAGKNVELPVLPVGTVITLKEIMPNNGALTTWNTPSYSSDVPGAVKDNGDGTATVTVMPDSFANPTKVTITNSASIPWWWILVPFIPVAIVEIYKQFVPKPPVPATSQTPAPSTPGQKGIQKSGEPTPANKTNEKGVAKAKGAKALAQTGASVLGILVAAMLLVALGVYLVRRGRTES